MLARATKNGDPDARDDERQDRRTSPQPPQAQLLEMQRTHGNAAVARMIARQKEEDSGGILAGIGAAIGAGAEVLFGPAEIDIGDSVGRGGKNAPGDVAMVRSRLTGLGYASGDDVESLGGAIERYQDEVVGLNRPDGRADPGGRTVKALSARKGKGAPAPAPAPGGGSIWGEPAAPAGGPAGAAPPAPAPAAPSGPRGALADAELDTLVGSARNATVDDAAKKVADLEQKYGKLTKGKQSEEEGEERDKLVEGIEDARASIAAIDRAGLDPKLASALKTGFYAALARVAPFYYQKNNVILEFDKFDKSGKFLKHVWNTCNITSVAMALEGLGKTSEDYKHKHLIPPIAEVYTKDVTSKEEGGRASGKVKKDKGDALAGLRLPDYIAMAAIVWQMKYKTGTPEQILAGGNDAFNNVPSIDAVVTLARDFGAKADYGKFRGTSRAAHDILTAYGEDHHKTADKKAAAETDLAEVEAELAKNPTGKRLDALQKKKEKLEATIAGAGSFTGGTVDVEKKVKGKKVVNTYDLEGNLELQSYKKEVMDALVPLLQAGKQIIGNQFNHFVRIQSVSDEGIVKDDPGSPEGANITVTWEEARAMGLFRYWVWVS